MGVATWALYPHPTVLSLAGWPWPIYEVCDAEVRATHRRKWPEQGVGRRWRELRELFAAGVRTAALGAGPEQRQEAAPARGQLPGGTSAWLGQHRLLCA